jgi:hypothetical protein
MDFEEFWESTKKFLVQGAELETISRANFKTNFDSAGGVIVVIPHSTNLPRDINKNDFKNVFEKMKDLNRRYDNVFRPALYQRITRNSSYILPIIKAVQTQGGKQKTFEKTKNVT